MLARFLLACGACAAVLGLAAPGALAQGNANGQFGISPARREIAGRPPANLAPTRVTNTTGVPFDVTVFPVLLHQELTGNFVFSELKSDLNAANNILTPSVKAFKLAPGQSHEVGLRWNTLPAHAKAAYVGVVFQGIPVINGKKNVNVTDRLLSINFLRLPGHYRSSGEFAGLQVTQAPQPKVLRFLPRVKNTGQVVDSPTHTSLVIESSTGRHLYKQTWPGDVVLPGVTREFTIDVRHLFGAGDYTAVALMDFGSSRHQIVKHNFHLTGPNTLPSPGVSVSRFGATGEIGKPAHLTAQVASTGTAPVTTKVALSLFHITGAPSDAKPVAQTTVTYTNLAPGTKRSLDVELGKVEPGHYKAVLAYRDPTNVGRTLAAEFDATKAQSFFDRLKRWLQDHAALLIGLLALILLAAVVYWFVRRQRRLERALAEREAATVAPAAPMPPAAAPAPPQPAVAAPGSVNINTAGPEELQQLPGVGPKAAERIVEHRDEYGPFASVDDLAKVQGFGAARVAELRDRATI